MALSIAAIVTALTALGVWVANNSVGLKDFVQGFANGFRDAIPPSVVSTLETVGSHLQSVWNWLSKILGPLDASEEKWRGWGYAAGLAVGAVVSAVTELPGKIAGVVGEFATAMTELAQAGWNAVVNFDWKGLGAAIVNAIVEGIKALAKNFISALSDMAAEGAAR